MAFDEDRMLSIGVGIAEGLDKATTNLMNISSARTKLNRENKEFELDTKIKKLEIQKAEDYLDPDQIKLRNERVKVETAAKKSAYNLNVLKIDTAEREEKEAARGYEEALSRLDTVAGGGNLRPGEEINLGGAYSYKEPTKKGITPTQQRKEDISVDEIIASLQTGTGWDGTGRYPLKNRELAVGHVLENWNADITDPRIQEALDQYKPREEKITTTKTGFLGRGKERQTKEKFGYTWEKQEDNQWHRID